METYQSRSHESNISNAFKRIVHTAIGFFDEHLLNWLLMILGVDEFGASKLLGNFEFIIVDVNANDAASAGLFTSQDGSQANSTQSKDSTCATSFDLE